MHIIAQLCSVATERGPCDELLLDNLTMFRSEMVAQFADEWGTPRMAIELLRGIIR